jgi:hypothetical protein
LKKKFENTENDGHVHDWVPTFEGGDTYRCLKCGKFVDMTEDDDF